MDSKESGLETSWRDGRNRVEIRDVIAIFLLPLGNFKFSDSMEIEDLFEEWDDVDLEGLESYLTEENGVDELDKEEVI